MKWLRLVKYSIGSKVLHHLNTDTLTFKYFIATVRLQTLANILMVTTFDFNLVQCDLNCATM